MKFIQYRSLWAHGPSHWSFSYFPETATNEDFEEFVNEKALEHTWSERFRSIEWHEVNPSVDIVNRFIRQTENEISGAQSRLNDLKEYKEKHCEEAKQSSSPGCD